MLEHLKEHLKGKVVIVGIGNKLRSDDGIGSLLASRIKDKVPYIVFDVETAVENYLGRIIKESPDNIVLIDAAKFGGTPGEFRELEAEGLESTNLFFTHNASLSLAINYLQGHIAADIIILAVEPKYTGFGDKLTPELEKTITNLEKWFYDSAK